MTKEKVVKQQTKEKTPKDSIKEKVAKAPKRMTTSKYQGVTLMKSTTRWRAQKNTQSLGEYDTEEKAAQAFDRASINLYGRNAKLNFPLACYELEIETLFDMTFEEIAQQLRDSAVTATPTSSYRGVSYLTACKKWRAQININNKQYHLGYYPTEEEAAMVFDRASIVRGTDKKKTKTNFNILTYRAELPHILDLQIQELQRILDDEKVGWKVAKSVLSSGRWEDLNVVLGRSLKPQSPSKCQQRMEQLSSAQKIQSVNKRQHCETQSPEARQNLHMRFVEQSCSQEDLMGYSQASELDFSAHKRRKVDGYFENQGYSPYESYKFGQANFSQTPTPSSVLESDSYPAYCGFQTPDQKFLGFNQNTLYKGKENLNPEDVMSKMGNIKRQPFDSDITNNNFTNKSFNQAPYTNQSSMLNSNLNMFGLTANERLIGLMSQQRFPQEIIAVVEDFDTDISEVRHAGSWKILRFMIQYSPQKFDHLDEMWLRLQNLIEYVIDTSPPQLPALQC